MRQINRLSGILLILLGAIYSFYCNAYAMSINMNDDPIEITRDTGHPPPNKNTVCIVGDGIPAKTQRDLPGFDKIDLNGAFDLHIGFQPEQSVKLLCEENLVSKISTMVSDGCLFISATESICPTSRLTLTIQLNNLDTLNCRGANDIVVESMDNARFTLKMAGSNDLRITGRTRLFNVDFSGAGDLHATRFKAEVVSIRSDGSSDAHVFASKKLDATLLGAGDIYYSGEPKRIISQIDGVGDLLAGEE